MNRNLKMALGFTLAALVFAQAHAQAGRVAQGGVLAMLGAAQPEGGQDARKDDLFAGTEQFEKNASEVNEINMDPDSLDIVRGPQAGSAHSMVLNVVRSYSYDKPGLYDVNAVNRFRDKLNTGDWRCTIHTRELKTGESTDVCYKRRTDGMREEAIITVEPKELTFIHRIRKGDGGHSDVSELPMMFDGQSFPMIANLAESPQMEVMAAKMEAQTAKLAALGPMIAARMSGLEGMQPQFEKLQESFKDMHFEKFGNTMKDFHFEKVQPMTPPPPEEPRPQE